MKTLILPTALTVMLFSGIYSFAQTDPVPFSMNTSGNYSFTVWNASEPAGTYPSNMMFHQFGAAPVTLSSVAVADITGAYNESNGTRINGQNGSGLMIINTANGNQTPTGYTTNSIGEVVLALNTTGRTKISLSFVTGTQATGTNGSTSKLRAQYRIKNGSWGPWKEISGTPMEYTSELIAPTAVFISPVILPAEVDNQEEVQIRWLMYYNSGTMSNGYKSPMIRLDDISVTSLPIVTLVAQDPACALSSSVALTGGSPSGGSFSGTFVSSNNFNPKTAGAGTHAITYTYTDPFGMTNSTNGSITVDLLACETQLNSSSCGRTNLTLSDVISTIPIPGANDYEYRFINSSTGFTQTKRRGSYLVNLFLNTVPGLQYGETYNVEVRFKVGSSWSEFGPVCSISFQQNIPLSSLIPSSCGATGLNLQNPIYTSYVHGAIDYEYEFSNPTLGFLVTKKRGTGLTNLFLYTVPGLMYGETYDVRVRANIGGVWSSYGTICPITLSNEIPLTQLNSSFCGASGLTYNDVLSTIPVTGATKYEYTFYCGSPFFSQTILRNTSITTLPLSFVQGLLDGETYQVSVRSYVAGEWSAPGAICEITMGTTPRAPIVYEEENNEKGNITVYPNPSNGIINLNLGTAAEAGLKIFNSNGQLVINEKIYSGIATFDLSGVSRGVYFVRIESNGEVYFQKIVISD